MEPQELLVRTVRGGGGGGGGGGLVTTGTGAGVVVGDKEAERVKKVWVYKIPGEFV